MVGFASTLGLLARTHKKPRRRIMVGRLNGKVALITGGGQGVGLGIAKRFAREEAALVLTGRDAAKLTVAAAELEQLGATVMVCPGDAADRAGAQAAVAQAI